jgi:hypothetical protein
MKQPKLRKSPEDAKALVLTAKAMATYVSMFTSMTDAAAFEKAVLSTVDIHLPPCARLVKAGGQPNALYWRWLAVTAEVWS